MTIKAILFDFDGTIADTRDAFIKIVNRLAPEFGYKSVSQEEIEKLNHSIPLSPFWGYIYKLSDNIYPISYIGSTTVSYDFRYATHLHTLNSPPTTKLYQWYREREFVMEPIIKCLVKTTLLGSILSINNPVGSASALTITPLAGGTNSVSAHLVIKRVS
jgi:hypothetical protein